LSVEDEDEIERLLLSYSPKFQKILQLADRQLRAGEGIGHDEFWQNAGGGPSSEALNRLNAIFRQTSHKLRDIRSGKNKNETDHVLLVDLVVECAREVSSQVRDGVLVPEQITVWNYVQRLASLKGKRLKALQDKERARPRLYLPRDLGERFIHVSHRIRLVNGSKDESLQPLADQPLEHYISEAFDRLRSNVALLRT
jgi:hypothetical protein